MAEQEEAKNARKNAKGKFTRKRNIMLDAPEEKKGIQIIEDTYAQLLDSWRNLEGKHEIYINTLKEEGGVNIAENWMAVIERDLIEAKATKLNYVNSITEMETKARAVEQERQQMEHSREQALVKRENTRTIFSNSCTSIEELIKIQAKGSIIKARQAELTKQYDNCCQAQERLLELLDRKTASEEMRWVSEIQSKYQDLLNLIELTYGNDDNKDVKPQVDAVTAGNIRLEKIKMPHFEGGIRDYPQFRKHFQTQVTPNLTEITAPYTLRSCLGKDALAQVKTVDDNIDEMWKRLDEKFGNPKKITDTIINDIKRLEIIKEGESEKFVAFVDLSEDSYRDLKRLKLEKEITTTSSVGIIESKLPSDVRKDWA